MHKDWPGQIHRLEDLVSHREEEAVDLASATLASGYVGFRLATLRRSVLDYRRFCEASLI